MFDLLTWCVEHLDGSQNGEEFPALCPFCGYRGKFSVNHVKLKFRCYRDTCRAGHAAHVVSQVEGIPLRDAFKRFEDGTPRSTEPAFRKAQTPQPSAWDIELPSEFIPCYQAGRDPEWRVIRYLRDRLQRDTLKTFGVGFCADGSYYNRAIIPISCPNGRAFIARDATTEHETNPARPRYLNAPGKWASEMLFGWPQYPSGADLALVEGSFDTMRYHEHGIFALGLLGKELSKHQAALLYTLPRDTRIVIAVDLGESMTVVDKIGAQLYARFRDLNVAKPLSPLTERPKSSKLDAGNSTRQEAYNSIDGARRWGT